AGELVHLSMGVGAFVLFMAACLFLAIALLRLARGALPNRPYLAGSFAALLLCALIIWGPASRWGPESNATNMQTNARAAQSLQKGLDFPALVLQTTPQGPPSRVVSKGRWLASAEVSEKSFAAIPPD